MNDQKFSEHDRENTAATRGLGTRAGAKHTPGPWEVFHPEAGRVRVGRSLNSVSANFVATISDQGRDPNEEKEANARLIAAAPELLALADQVARGLFGPAILQEARDAFSKATGTVWAGPRVFKAKGQS